MAICLSATLRGAPIVRPAGEERSLLSPSLSPFVRVFFAFHHRGINPGLEESLLLEPPISLSSQPCFSPRSFCPPCAQSTSASSEARIFFLFPGRDSLTLETMEDRDDRMKLQLLRGRAACMYNPALRTVPRYHLSSH